MPRTLLFRIAVSAAVLLAPTAPASDRDGQPGPDPEPPAQIYCPVTIDEEIDPEIFTDYKGQRVYFCCHRCKIRFTRDSEQYAARLVNAPLPAVSQAAGHEHEDAHEHGAEHGAATESQESADHEHGEAAGTSAAEHDHAEHGGGASWQKWLGGFHPPMVNFPIGVLVAAALAEALFIVRRRPEFDHVARFCVRFAVVAAVAAGTLGWLFAGIRLTDTDPLLRIHRWLGTATVLWLVALLWTSERAHRPAQSPSPSQAGARSWYRFLLFAGTALVLATGFFGGSMVYGLDHYALP